MVDESVLLETDQEVDQEFNTSLSNKVIKEEICETENNVKGRIKIRFSYI